jgi:TPR repeat protein
MAPPPATGLRIWAPPLAGLLALILGPLLLFPTPLHALAEAWCILLILAGWLLGVSAFVGPLARASTPPLALVARGIRRWVARFAPEPELLWLHWARQAHHPAMGWWCLERARRFGGSEALFQEGLAYLEGGLGPGGVITGVARMRLAAEAGHAEAAFRLGEALRTGHGCGVDAPEAEGWYRRSAAAGFGPAAAWLAHAYGCGDGVGCDEDAARRWAEHSARLEPHPPLARPPFRHDAAPGDPLVRVQGEALAWIGAVMARIVSTRTGRTLLLLGAALLAGFWCFTAAAFFWVGSSSLHHLPLLMLAPPFLLLGWQALKLRREGPRRGRDRLRERAEAGDGEACFRLGLAYRKGTSLHPRDDLTAVLWFSRAAEAGHREAMTALAEAYRGGHGVPRDPRTAARWEEASRIPES